MRGVLISGAMVEALVGPAGTGKSRVVGASRRRGRPRACGTANSDGWSGWRRRRSRPKSSPPTAYRKNVARWLHTQQRLADGTAAHGDWLALRAGDLVVLDESAMTNTRDLAEIQAHCDEFKAKLLLVGDQRQLAAVGAGGGMELVTATRSPTN